MKSSIALFLLLMLIKPAHSMDWFQSNSPLERAHKDLLEDDLGAMFDDLVELQDAAEAELSDLKSLLRGQAWKDAVEEVMRDHVRQRYPIVNAQAVWNALNQ